MKEGSMQKRPKEQGIEKRGGEQASMKQTQGHRG